MVKSQVRENRPPGSLRGPPGNRRPYRDHGDPTGQFLRNQIKDGPVESDWFAETREGMKLMSERVAP